VALEDFDSFIVSKIVSTDAISKTFIGSIGLDLRGNMVGCKDFPKSIFAIFVNTYNSHNHPHDRPIMARPDLISLR
jgi:hypothetical protein